MLPWLNFVLGVAVYRAVTPQNNPIALSLFLLGRSIAEKLLSGGYRATSGASQIQHRLLLVRLVFPMASTPMKPPVFTLSRLVENMTVGSKVRPHPHYGWDFPEEIPEKNPERPRKRSQSLSCNSRVRLGSLKSYNSSHLRLLEHIQNSPPPVPQYCWGRLYFQKWLRRGPLRAVVMEFPAVLGTFLKGS